MPKALLTAVAAAGLALTGCGSDSGREPRAQLPRDALVVDLDSRGGPCRDARKPARVSPKRPWCSIDAALAAAPDGAVVYLRGGAYPVATAVRGRTDAKLTFRPAPGEQVTLAGLVVEQSSGYRFDDFDFAGKVWILNSRDVELVRGGFSPQGVVIRSSDGVLIERSRFHDLTYEGSQVGAGYAVSMLGGSASEGAPPLVSNVTIRGNSFRRVPADAIQMGTVENISIEGNEFTEVTPYLRADEHSDAIQMLGSSNDVRIRRNYFHDQPRALIVKKAPALGLVIEDNVMVRLSGVALNIYDAPGVRIAGNTVWDTLLGLRFQDLPQVPQSMRGAVVVDNLIDSMGFAPDHVAEEDHNLIGDRKDYVTYGPHDEFPGDEQLAELAGERERELAEDVP